MKEPKIDHNGFKFYNELPDNCKLAIISDFIIIDPDIPNVFHKRKIGMKYLLYSEISKRYELYELGPGKCDEDIIPFIKEKRCYVFT